MIKTARVDAGYGPLLVELGHNEQDLRVWRGDDVAAVGAWDGETLLTSPSLEPAEHDACASALRRLTR